MARVFLLATNVGVSRSHVHHNFCAKVRGNKIERHFNPEPSGGGNHQPNFIKAVRSRKVSDLNADILEGHLSSALCHLGNISHKLGQLSEPEEIKESIKDNPHALSTFERFREHLSDNWVDIAQDKAVLGPCLEIDPGKEKFIDKGEYGLSRWANQLLRRNYRRPFVVPEEV